VRRILGTLLAVVLGVGGVLLLVGYVRGAEERALAGEELVTVLVADRAIERGEDAGLLAEAVKEIEVPVKVRAEDAVTDLAALEGLAVSVDLVPGEQLLMSRFVAPKELQTFNRIEAPSDTIEITVSLSPERAVGGQLSPGDLVAVFASFDPFDVTAVEPGEGQPAGVFEPGEDGESTYIGTTEGEGAPPRTPNSTGLLLHKVMVTNVQLEQLPRKADDEELGTDIPDLAPTGNLLITLAAPPEEAQRVVFTAEHGFLWLGNEPADAPEPAMGIENRGTIYR
jgi:pilus assembly protein CpaB